MAKILLRKLLLENVGQHRGPLELGPLSAGLNLITGPNESGKSTIVKALRAVMFEKHSAKHAQIKELQPYGEPKAAPRIAVELSFGDQLVAVEKRFLLGPSAELRVNGGAPLTGDEADAKLRELLGAGRPTRQGVKSEELGMWGLLWLDQDDTARVEPGEAMSGSTREKLTEVIHRQVGQVTSGRGAERLHAELSKLFELYWTSERQQPTGDYGRALERTQALKTEVQDLERRAAELKTQGEAVDRARAERDAAQRLLAVREAELTQARARAEAAARLAERRAQAEQARDLAAERLAHARAARHGREDQVQALARKEAALAAQAQASAELAAQVEAAQTDAAEVAAALREREQAHETARSALERAVLEMTEATQREALERDLQRHAEAERLRAELAEVQRRLEEEAITETAHRALQARAREVLELERAVASAATQLVLRVGVEPEALHVLTAETQLSTPHGPLTVRPGRPGVAKAAEALRTHAARLEEALRGAGVSDLAAARRARSQRAGAESRAAELQAALDEAAPEGLEAVIAGGERARGEEARLAEAMHAAEQAEVQARALREALEPQRVREEDAQELRALSQALERAASRLSALGTVVVVRAEQALALELPDGETCALEAGVEHTLQVTRASSVGVRGVVALSIEPLGGDLAAAERELASCRAKLEAALARLGVESVAAAEEAVARRAALVGSLAEVARELERRAPEGLDRLRSALAALRSRREDLERRSHAAQSARAGLAQANAELQRSAVTAEVLVNLEQLDAARATAREAAEGLAAVLHLPGEPSPRRVVEAARGAAEGLEWALTPGELNPELVSRLDAEREALARALSEHGAPSLEAAEARWRVGLELQPQCAALEEQLAQISGAYASLAFGQTAQQALAAMGEAGTQGVDAAYANHTRAQEAEASARAALTDARERAARLSERAGALGVEASHARGALGALEREVRELSSRLEAERAAAADAALEAAEVGAEAEAQAAAEALAAADAALAGVVPELEARGVRAAEEVLEQCRERIRKTSDAASRAEALLDAARVDGRHEILADKRAELEAAGAERSRLQREAEAVKLLARLAEEERARAEQRLLQPVLEAVAPYVRALRPGTELRLSQALKVEAVVRAGVTEELAKLSGGTREQLAVIVRLGLAKVLARGGHVFPLILDDTLGWTDDQRFGEMVRILDAASEEMQIVVLSCHATRFERLGAGWRRELG